MARIARMLVHTTLLAAILTFGCSHPGSEFVGQWVNTTNANDTMNITRNGDQFLILAGHDKIGATYKDGALQVPSMMGTMTMTYVQSSDTLLAPGFLGQSEYKRIK